MANLKFISTGSTTVTLSGNGLSNSFTANGSAYTLGTAISLADGEYVEFAGSTNDFSKDGSHYYQFSIGGTGTVEVEGDLISLTNNNAFVKQYQFVNLFKDCTKITSIANLNFPASIADFCYSNMFAHCTGLVNGGTTLPATSVSRWCYNGMFVDCSSMTTPPTILATKVAPFSYYGMFMGCDSLKNGPNLFYKTLEGDYSSNIMFKDCSSLSSVKVNFTNQPTGTELKNWLSGVAENGVLIKPNTLSDEISSFIPESWTLSSYIPPSIVVNTIPTFTFDAQSETDIICSLLDYATYNGEYTLNCEIEGELPEGLSCVDGIITGVPTDLTGNCSESFDVVYSALDAGDVLSSFDLEIINVETNYYTLPLTFQNISNDSVSFYINRSNATNLSLKYSKDSGKWNTLSYNSSIEIPAGSKVEISGINSSISPGEDNYYNSFKFSGNGRFKVYGNVNSIVCNSDGSFGMGKYAYTSLFDSISQLVDAYNLKFPSPYIITRGFRRVFYNCTNLSAGPKEIDCVSLSSDAWFACCQMFQGCSSLKFAPHFKMVSINSNAYEQLCKNCTSLEKAPLFDTITGQAMNNAASEMPFYSFNESFYGCSNLSAIEVKFTDWLPHRSDNPNMQRQWVSGVKNFGLFIVPYNWTGDYNRGVTGVPTNWLILKRQADGSLKYGQSYETHSEGDDYLDEYGADPYAQYYQ